MRLSVTTPLRIVVEAEDVFSLRAEDETGSFGILPGHADFLTVLNPSVITWRSRENCEHHVAVRSGILMVRQGQFVEVVTHEAVTEDTLGELSEAVVENWRTEKALEEEAYLSASHLHLAAIHQIVRYLDAGRPRQMLKRDYAVSENKSQSAGLEKSFRS